MVDAESTPLPCGPPAIQFILSTTIFVSRLKIFVLRSLSACYFIAAYTAVAVVDKVFRSSYNEDDFFDSSFILSVMRTLVV